MQPGEARCTMPFALDVSSVSFTVLQFWICKTLSKTHSIQCQSFVKMCRGILLKGKLW